MPADFLPKRESELLSWSANFRDRLLASAPPGQFGVSPAQAAQYAVLHDQWEVLYQAAQDPGRRTPSGIVAKDDQKARLCAEARLLARLVRAAPTVSDAQRIELGLSARREGRRAGRIPAPAEAPLLRVTGVRSTTVTLRLIDRAHDTRRRKPAGVAGAAVFSFVGEEPPAQAPGGGSAWRFEGTFPRTTLDVTFRPGPETPPAARVWFTAFWLNPRGQGGPACRPVGAYLHRGGDMAVDGGVVMSMAA